ncbi:MAG TPA: NirD/YgiW/YdeI family stress tolerance protein [Candidatus Methylacidiphilales bacterium]
MKNTLLCVLAIFAFLALPKMVQASEDPDSNRYHVTSIRWIKSVNEKLDDDDRYVVLCGKVTKKEGDETYWFTDGTGTIKLDSEPKLPLDKPIVIRGRIDQDWLGWGTLEVDVRTWRNEPAPK